MFLTANGSGSNRPSQPIVVIPLGVILNAVMFSKGETLGSCSGTSKFASGNRPDAARMAHVPGHFLITPTLLPSGVSMMNWPGLPGRGLMIRIRFPFESSMMN